MTPQDIYFATTATPTTEPMTAEEARYTILSVQDCEELLGRIIIAVAAGEYADAAKRADTLSTVLHYLAIDLRNMPASQ